MVLDDGQEYHIGGRQDGRRQARRASRQAQSRRNMHAACVVGRLLLCGVGIGSGGHDQAGTVTIARVRPVRRVRMLTKAGVQLR